MIVHPLRDYILVKRLPAETVSSGGIIIPDNAKEKPTMGEVLAVGPGRVLDNGTTVAPAVHIGEKVIFARYAGTETMRRFERAEPESDHILIHESDILAVIED